MAKYPKEDVERAKTYLKVERPKMRPSGTNWYVFNPKTGEIDYITRSKVLARVQER